MNFIMSSFSEVQFREKRIKSLLMQNFLAVHVYSPLNLCELLNQNVEMSIF